MLESNAQKCLDKICNGLLGKDFYIVSPVNQYQANEIITETILKKYAPQKTLKQKIKDLIARW